MSEPSPRRMSYSTIDATDWLEQRDAQRQPDQWWVVMMCNQSGGEHTKIVKITDPWSLKDASPQREGSKLWAVSNILLAGSEEVADGVMDLLHGNLRGSVSKAAFLDVISRHYKLEHYGSFAKILKIPNADEQLERVPGLVVDSD